MAASVAKGNNGVCTTDAARESVSRTNGDGTDIRSSNAIYSITKNLRTAYPGVECNVT